jgi:hypothetical protein
MRTKPMMIVHVLAEIPDEAGHSPCYCIVGRGKQIHRYARDGSKGEHGPLEQKE